MIPIPVGVIYSLLTTSQVYLLQLSILVCWLNRHLLSLFEYDSLSDKVLQKDQMKMSFKLTLLFTHTFLLTNLKIEPWKFVQSFLRAFRAPAWCQSQLQSRIKNVLLGSFEDALKTRRLLTTESTARGFLYAHKNQLWFGNDPWLQWLQ